MDMKILETMLKESSNEAKEELERKVISPTPALSPHNYMGLLSTASGIACLILLTISPCRISCEMKYASTNSTWLIKPG